MRWIAGQMFGKRIQNGRDFSVILTNVYVHADFCLGFNVPTCQTFFFFEKAAIYAARVQEYQIKKKNKTTETADF